MSEVRQSEPSVARGLPGADPRALVAEALGTALLVAAVVGSGIMAERLSGGQQALALLANTLATGAALLALILCFGPISGAHFNPLVSAALAFEGRLELGAALRYAGAQFVGGLLGTVAAQAMFGLPLIQASARVRSGPDLWLSEALASFTLLLVIGLCSRRRPEATPLAVAATITAAYWFTASTSFANPAVTLARAATDTFAGIRLADVPAFWIAAAGAPLARWIAGPVPSPSPTQPPMKTVLFACVHNAGRSQMAAAFLNRLADPQLARAISAGTSPADHVHPEVQAVMAELDIDLSGARPQRLTRDLASTAQLLITMGCGDKCPSVPGLRVMDWPLPDPKGQGLDQVRSIRDEVRRRVLALLRAEGWLSEAAGSELRRPTQLTSHE
jgi:glycerol uptake facilitator-like aquaporin/protein-tyrosine-phosphatase